MSEAPKLRESIEMAQAVLRGDSTEDLRNRFRKLDEAASRGSAMTLSAMADTGMIESKRSSWAQVYSGREREIRAAMRGYLGPIQESITKKRFRVLATEYAPEDMDRYYPDLKESSEKVADQLDVIANRCANAVDEARGASSRYMTPAEAVLHGNVVGFVESIHEDVVSLISEFRAIMGSSDPRSLATLAKSHDFLADGLEDFTIAISFAEKTLTQTGDTS